MPGHVWLPRILFNFFPYFNDERFSAEQSGISAIATSTLENITVEKLNQMTYEEFQMIMDTPPSHYITSPSTIQIQLASNPTLNDVKRGIMIDRLIADDTEPDLVSKLLKLYSETNRLEIKEKIVQDLMLYDQRHKNLKSYIDNDQPKLKGFFDELLNDKPLSPKMADDVIRGFIDTHSSEEIMSNLDEINKSFSFVNHHSSIMLKYTLVFKSKELQSIFIKSIIDELREANDSDLDSYLFGPLSIGYQNSGKNLLEPESRQLVSEYLKDVRYKYIKRGIEAEPQDFHRKTTAPYYFELMKYIGKEP